MCRALFPNRKGMRAPLYGSGGDGVIYPLIPKLARSVLDVHCSVSKSQVYAGPDLWLRRGRWDLSTDPTRNIDGGAVVQL
jgi:hypothetical protein